MFKYEIWDLPQSWTAIFDSRPGKQHEPLCLLGLKRCFLFSLRVSPWKLGRNRNVLCLAASFSLPDFLTLNLECVIGFVFWLSKCWIFHERWTCPLWVDLIFKTENPCPHGMRMQLHSLVIKTPSWWLRCLWPAILSIDYKQFHQIQDTFHDVKKCVETCISDSSWADQNLLLYFFFCWVNPTKNTSPDHLRGQVCSLGAQYLVQCVTCSALSGLEIWPLSHLPPPLHMSFFPYCPDTLVTPGILLQALDLAFVCFALLCLALCSQSKREVKP